MALEKESHYEDGAKQLAEDILLTFHDPRHLQKLAELNQDFFAIKRGFITLPIGPEQTSNSDAQAFYLLEVSPHEKILTMRTIQTIDGTKEIFHETIINLKEPIDDSATVILERTTFGTKDEAQRKINGTMHQIKLRKEASGWVVASKTTQDAPLDELINAASENFALARKELQTSSKIT